MGRHTGHLTLLVPMRHGADRRLKLTKIERGTSADEIERVLAAKSTDG